MVVRRPIKEIKKRAKADGIEITDEQIDKTLEYYEDHLFDKLSKGEEIKIKEIGKVTPSIVQGHSMLTGKKETYETVKFKFTAFNRIKSETKEKLIALQKKHL